METGTLFAGIVVGFIVGALVFTGTGREVTGAAGKRIAREISR